MKQLRTGWQLHNKVGTCHTSQQTAPHLVNQIFGPQRLAVAYLCQFGCVGPTYTRVKFGAKMENMGQRQECGYEEMGINSYKSQNWFGLVNMANVQKYFLNRIHSLFQDLVYISWKWQVNLNIKI